MVFLCSLYEADSIRDVFEWQLKLLRNPSGVAVGAAGFEDGVGHQWIRFPEPLIFQSSM